MHSHGPQAHLVQFYENERFLIAGLADFIGAALSGGDKGIVIAARNHLDQLENTLAQRGLLGGDTAHNYIPIDANHMLPLFMANGLPDQTWPGSPCTPDQPTPQLCAGHRRERRTLGKCLNTCSLPPPLPRSRGAAACPRSRPGMARRRQDPSQPCTSRTCATRSTSPTAR
ncbi:hypothetical protein HHL21_17000 [Massilia sp. RP-1-19]|uniref:Uncharacterized protein n=1 Tax=Massilia polaris TaxID=2728846 RepID=A0A848HP15_9BURK|nr:hypothetical protein [Massilia polaris]NML62747.1 hypothetical protein [Massilia polaris]